MDLTITRKHSYGATRSSSDKCVVVRALADVGIIAKVYAKNGKREHYFVQLSPRKRIELPRTLGDAITAYDAGKGFRYGTYRIPGLKRPKAD